MERKMASIQRVLEVKEIPGADAIEAVRVNGWWVVAKKGEFPVDSLCVYCEIDSWIPYDVAPFLSKGKDPREYNGVKGERLRTVKLRGQLSQGILLPCSIVRHNTSFSEGDDVSEILGIVKWEAPEEAGRCQEAKGTFPHFLKKTDQERVQNLSRTLEQFHGKDFEVTIKLDGSSLTCYHFSGEVGVCSRNINLKEVEGNGFWDVAKKYNLVEKLKTYGKNIAIQGELIAPNIQSNHEKVNSPEFRCFSIWDIDSQVYLLPSERRELCRLLSIPHVPVLDDSFILEHTVDELLEYAEGDGMNQGVKREGVVFKSNNDQFSFKVVSNSYLLKKK